MFTRRKPRLTVIPAFYRGLTANCYSIVSAEVPIHLLRTER